MVTGLLLPGCLVPEEKSKKGEEEPEPAVEATADKAADAAAVQEKQRDLEEMISELEKRAPETAAPPETPVPEQPDVPTVAPAPERSEDIGIFPSIPKNPVLDGTKLRYPDGRVYTGEIRDGKPHGYGTMVYPNGNTMTGNWADGAYFGRR
jgi:hypothetical protein